MDAMGGSRMIHKYRAYDEEAEFMVYSDKETDDYCFGFLDGEVKCWALEEMIDPNDPMEPPFMGTRKINNLMQSTGLKGFKDNHKKEIYAGDIVVNAKVDRKDYSSDTLKDCVVVVEMGNDWPLVLNESERLIIGNIHQHPELLDK